MRGGVRSAIITTPNAHRHGRVVFGTPYMTQRDEFTGHQITQRARHQMRVLAEQFGWQPDIGQSARRHPDIALCQAARC
jgi:hypothetical protein